MSFSITNNIIDYQNLRSQLLHESAGAYCSFEGWVRNHNDGFSVEALEYKCYLELALKQGQHIIDEANNKFDLTGCVAVHRIGTLSIGDIAVYVGVTSKHRKESFLACRYLIDNIKHRVPIWKKEHYVSALSQWIDPTQCDCADPENLTSTPSHHDH